MVNDPEARAGSAIAPGRTPPALGVEGDNLDLEAWPLLWGPLSKSARSLRSRGPLRFGPAGCGRECQKEPVGVRSGSGCGCSRAGGGVRRKPWNGMDTDPDRSFATFTGFPGGRTVGSGLPRTFTKFET